MMKNVFAAGLLILCGTVSAESVYSFNIGNGKTVWQEKECRTTNENGKTETITAYQNADGSLLLTETKTSYQNYPVVEWMFSLTNTGREKSPLLTNVLAADLDLDAGENPVLWHGIGESEDAKENYSFQRDALTEPMSFSPRLGYPSYHAFPYFRLIGRKQTLTIAIGWCGTWQAKFEPAKNGKVHFSAGQKNVSTYLKPGETFVSPRITILSAENEEAGAQFWRSWFREYILPRENGGPLQPKFVGDGTCSHGELYTEITIAEFLDTLKTLREAGFKLDAWWIDAGWYSTAEMLKNKKGILEYPGLSWFLLGNWVPDPKRFPEGFKPLADELRKTNTDLVLWYEPERIHNESVNFNEVKSYLSPNISMDSGRYDLARPEVLEYLEKTIADSLKQNGAAVLRQDSNGVGPEPFWNASDEAQGKDRTGSTENFYIQNMYKFWDYVRKNAGIKFIDNCASGGRRNDLETLRHCAVPLHYSDIGYTEFILKQRYTYMLAQWFMYYKNIVQFDCVDGKPDFYRIVIDLAPFSTIHAIAGEPLHYPEEKKLYARIFNEARPYLINADYHLLTPEVFDETAWTVCQYHDPKTESGLIRVIRNPKAADETYPLRPRSLDPEKTYVFTDLRGRIPEFELTGQQVFALPLAPADATILKYRVKSH